MQMSSGIIYSLVYTECLSLAGHCSRTENILGKIEASSLLNQQGVEKTQRPFPILDVERCFKLYQLGQNIHSSPVTSYGKTRVNFLASPIHLLPWWLRR